MRKLFTDDHHYQQNFYVGKESKSYGFFGFVFDCLMTFVTGGLWLIWVFVREMRRR